MPVSHIRYIALHFEKKIDKEILVETFAYVLGVDTLQFRFLENLNDESYHDASITLELSYYTQGYSTYSCLIFNESILKELDDTVFALALSQQLGTNVFVEVDERFGVICTPDGTTFRTKFDYDIGEDEEEYLVLY